VFARQKLNHAFATTVSALPNFIAAVAAFKKCGAIQSLQEFNQTPIICSHRRQGMKNNLLPEVSAWYQDLVSGNMFEIVAYDEQNQTIEYQLVDGEIGEYDISSWQQLLISPAEPPEDWGSSFDFTADDEAYNDDAMVPENWSGALSDLEPDSFDLGDDFQYL